MSMDLHPPRLSSAVRKSRIVYHVFLTALILTILLLAFLLILPFINTLTLSVILATLCFPLQVRLVRLLHGRRSLAAGALTVAVTCGIIIPVLIAVAVVSYQLVISVGELQDWIMSKPWEALSENHTIRSMLMWFRFNMASLNLDLDTLTEGLTGQLQAMAGGLMQQGAGVVTGLTTLVSRFFIMLFMFFFLVRDGEGHVVRLKELMPLHTEQKDLLLGRINAVFHSIILGNVFTALLQGLAAAIGMAIVGFSFSFWFVLAVASAFVPMVGTGLVFIPTVAYLLANGRVGWAIFLSLWGLLVVGTIDNYARPFLMRGESNMSPFTLFLALLGGLLFFGLPGLIYGPLIFGMAKVMLVFFREEYIERP